MKKFKQTLAMILCLSMLFCLFGCGTPSQPTEPSTETTVPPETEPAQLTAYRTALEKVVNASSLSMRVTSVKATTVGGQSFSENLRQSITCSGLGTEDVRYTCEENASYSGPNTAYATSYDEVYAGGTLYMTVDNSYRYSGTYTAEEMASWYYPAAPIDPDLYGDIAIDGNVLTFTQPTAAESWALPEEAELIDATATVTLSDGGDLQKSCYQVTYAYGSAEVTLDVEIYVTLEEITIEAPADTDAYLPLQSLEAARLVEAGVGYLYQADSVSTYSLQSIWSEAAGYLENVGESIDTYNGEEYMAKNETDVFSKNYYYNETNEYNVVISYIDGVYSYEEDGGESVTVPGVTDEQVMSIYDDGRADEIIAFSAWQDAVVTDLGTLYLVELTLNEDFGSTMQDNIVSYLWSDADYLNNLSTAYTNGELTAYVGIDKYTGLPTATGYYYEGTHTIDGHDYLLSWQLDQSIEAPSTNAYKTITDEMPPEEAPETDPTPLFYHVTGSDGQEMWLFGTIHVGDNRTAYLPQEIYDALAASDALAVECDTEGFDEQCEEDETLQAAVSDAYYYSDGTTVKDHIDAELYELAVKYAKATGNYNINSEYLKAYIWGNGVDNFYLRQSYRLTAEQGVEERLTKFAADNGIALREVESSLFQIQMMTGWSDELQELLLEDILETHGRDNWEGSMELFDMWCAGDEGALRERISDEVDTSEMTEEELAEYEESKHLLEEYNKSMSYDRNDNMLQVLTGYLESGDTVFVAVGLAHLLNNVNGLVDALQNAGYTVELVQYGE